MSFSVPLVATLFRASSVPRSVPPTCDWLLTRCGPPADRHETDVPRTGRREQPKYGVRPLREIVLVDPHRGTTAPDWRLGRMDHSLFVHRNGRFALRVAGDIDVLTAPGFKAVLLEEAKRRRSPLVLDVSMVPFIDSMGLRVLFQVATTLRGGHPRGLATRLERRTDVQAPPPLQVLDRRGQAPQPALTSFLLGGGRQVQRHRELSGSSHRTPEHG